MAFTLELLHIADQEAGAPAIADAPNLSAVLNGLRAEDLGGDGIEDNTLTLSSGDAFIPGLFYDASGAAFGSGGIADIQIQNELGIQAISLGNHEFDFGPAELAGLISGEATGDFSSLIGSSLEGQDFLGAAFPYLSTNLDFSTDANLAPLEVEGGAAPQANSVTSSVTIDVNGETIGVVGATTPTLPVIASPGDVTVLPTEFDGNPTDAQLDALAAEIQAEVDALLAADPALNKVVLLAHMQRIDIEFALAERLTDVDIIVAGGSNTRLLDEDDRLRDGDSVQGEYPTFIENAGGTQTAVVNTDGNYKYVGRLVIEFDEDGNILPESYDAAVSGAYATDDQGVADLGAAGLVDPEIQAIVDAIEAEIIATEGNVFGVSDVFLNGNRTGTGEADDPDGVRSQETNLGNLTADANLAEAKLSDPDVVISLKNGGGIRDSIGQTIVPPGGVEAVREPNEAVVDSDGVEVKPEGGISETDIRTTLAFNNGLSILTLTAEELVAVLEHSVGDIGGGRFPQVSGVNFSFDPDLDPGARVQSVAVVDEDGEILSLVMDRGEMVADPAQTFRIVTLNFLADGGDGYPFPTGPEANRVDLFVDADGDGRVDPDGPIGGDAVFAPNGSEQDALAEYLDDNFSDPASAFSQEDVGPEADTRVQNLSFRIDTVAPVTGPAPAGELAIERLFQFEGGGAEIVAVDGGFVYVTNSAADQIDVLDLATGAPVDAIDLTGFENYKAEGVTSVTASNGLVAFSYDGLVGDGRVAVMTASGETAVYTVGNLPDAVAFSPDGTKILVSNEGEFDEDETDNPQGTVSIIDLSAGFDAGVVTTLDFTAFDGQEDALRAEGVRIFPGETASVDLEPEFWAWTPDGQQAVVSLQENNAFALIDLSGSTPVISEIVSQGVVDHSAVALDANDRDGGIDLQTYENLVGLRMADGITIAEIGGEAFLFAAGEGDDRGDFDEPENGPIGDAARVGDILDGEVPGVSIDPLVDTSGLERLNVSVIDGDTDGDGDIDVLHAYGARGLTIYNLAGEVVAETGDLFARIAATLNAEEFQGNEDEFDTRSDNKGVEPESVVVGEIDGRSYAFVGLERDSGIVILDVTDPANPVFDGYINDSELSVADISPEGLAFVSAEDAGGAPLLLVSFEESGTTVAYEISPTPTGDETLIGGGSGDTFDGRDGDDVIRGRNGDDTLSGGSGEDVVRGGNGDDVLDGGDDDDRVVGGNGDDMVSGGDGDDILRGGEGDDTLEGGEGVDTFFFLAPNGGDDVITDFEVGVDRIRVKTPGVDASDVSVVDGAEGAVVSFAETSVTVEGVSAAALEDQFVFG